MNCNEDLKKRIYELVAKIPRGRVSTYKIVGDLAGVNSYRIVGKVLKENYDENVPCHRIVRSDGSLGGYNRGVLKKLEILEEEGVFVEKGKIKDFDKVLLDFKDFS